MKDMPYTMAEIESESFAQGERERQAEFARRRAAPAFVKHGIDECSATGAGHGLMVEYPANGRRYCEYCGAEELPV